MGEHESNEAGHWESARICMLNERLLFELRSGWDDWRRLDMARLAPERRSELISRACKTVDDEFGDADIFVLKDPRICRLAPFWFDVFEESGIKPFVVIPLRNPIEVARSLTNRNGFHHAFGRLLWLRHVLDAEFDTRDVPRTFVRYDELLTDWRAVAGAAQKSFGLNWPQEVSAAPEIEAFLSQGLRHHNVPAEAVTEDFSVATWVREAYGVMQRWSRDGEDAEGRMALDQIREALETATPIFAELVDRAAELELEAKRWAEANDETVVADLEGQLVDTEAELRKARARVAELEKAVAHRDALLRQAEKTAGENEELVRQTQENAEQVRSYLLTEYFRALDALLAVRPGISAWVSGQNRTRLALLRGSGLFDADWYRSHYSEEVEDGTDPAEHFIERGIAKGYAPNPILAEAQKPRERRKNS